MGIAYYIKKALSMSPAKVIGKVKEKVSSKLYRTFGKKRDLRRDSRDITDTLLSALSYININELNIDSLDIKIINYLADGYTQHRFDLLGSGWVEYSYSQTAIGVEGHRYDMNLPIDAFDADGEWLSSVLKPAYLSESKKIWSMVSDGYRPIDWQKDVKSGYRFSAYEWYLDQRVGESPGVDIKMPWEIGRLQHLPQMATFARALPERRDALIIEFRNQTLDFFAVNPPRMGANWTCTMDVGIRSANLMVAYDLFTQLDDNGILDEEYRALFICTMYLHAEHIINNLEYSTTMTSNHYLSDICGLLFISAYLEGSSTIDRWLAFSLQEFIVEMEKEFYPDGSNFEASTSYHRLSGELMTYTSALVLGLPESKLSALRTYRHKPWKVNPKLFRADAQMYNHGDILPEWFIERLMRSGLFTSTISKANGEIPQVGDNDSGRFFRLSPNGNFISSDDAIKRYANLDGYKESGEYWDENILEHSTFLAALSGILTVDEFASAGERFKLEKSIVSAMAKGKVFNPTLKDVKIDINKDIDESNLPDRKEHTYHYDGNGTLTDGIKVETFPDFGISVFRSKHLYLSVFYGGVGQNGNGGHSHNDKLAFDLSFDGEDIVCDPGTYLYTPLFERRNEFRSVHAHTVPIVRGEEQNRWLEGRKGLFQLANETKCRLYTLTDDEIKIELSYRDTVIRRSIKIYDKDVVVIDECNQEFEIDYSTGGNYSNGYGKLVRKY